MTACPATRDADNLARTEGQAFAAEIRAEARAIDLEIELLTTGRFVIRDFRFAKSEYDFHDALGSMDISASDFDELTDTLLLALVQKKLLGVDTKDAVATALAKLEEVAAGAVKKFCLIKAEKEISDDE